MAIKFIGNRAFNAKAWFSRLSTGGGWFNSKFVNATSSITTISPTEGAVVIAGNVAAIALVLAVSSGAITISGNAPSITKVLAPSTGAVVLSGNVPAIQETLTPGQGSIALSGNAPSITVAALIAPTEGAIVLTGYVPDITVTPPAFFIDTHDGGDDRKRHKRHKKAQEERLAQIRHAFAVVAGEVGPPPVVNEIRFDYAQGVSIDFEALARNVALVEQLLAAYQRALDDDDDATILLL